MFFCQFPLIFVIFYNFSQFFKAILSFGDDVSMMLIQNIQSITGFDLRIKEIALANLGVRKISRDSRKIRKTNIFLYFLYYEKAMKNTYSGQIW